ncbi:MAG TPA: maleylacetoacetate isomerase [Aliiroseovarius sp.]|nr:maleylacetoacetate isomerase [Aliiroseovarius sp.]
MKLYSYWRSTTSYRVRIVLNLKGFDYDIVPVDLVAGAQRTPEYSAMNPGRGVPVLELEGGTRLTQSLAIIDYLDALRPDPAILPAEPLARARVKAAAHLVALDIHPVNNLRVVQHLEALGHSKADVVDWMVHWMHEGLAAYQAMIAPDTRFSFGDTPDLADICMVAQLYNGRRWGLDLTSFARIVEIEQACLALPAFDAARPENQPDAI